MKLNPASDTVVVKEYQLDIGQILVYDNYMVSIIKHGATINLEKTYQLIGIAELHFRDKNFGYISVRKNSYALDPTIYTYLRGLKNLKAFAIVSTKELDMHNFNIEKLFYKKAMKLFLDFESGAHWVQKRLLKFR
ncbi:MAG: STAS/SEC14 domain-containing protein [Flavobacteriaceae bacterium]|nr:STAS/SEC14 domain-containing protein [Flavobacteriaceae bacterium]